MLHFWHRNGIFEMDNRAVLSLCGGCFNVLLSVGIYVMALWRFGGLFSTNL